MVQSQTKDYNKTLDLKEKLVYALNVLCLGLILTRCLCKRTKKNQRWRRVRFPSSRVPPDGPVCPLPPCDGPTARVPCPAWPPSPLEIPVRKPEPQEPQRQSSPGLRGRHVATVVSAPPWGRPTPSRGPFPTAGGCFCPQHCDPTRDKPVLFTL